MGGSTLRQARSENSQHVRKRNVEGKVKGQKCGCVMTNKRFKKKHQRRQNPRGQFCLAKSFTELSLPPYKMLSFSWKTLLLTCTKSLHSIDKMQTAKNVD